MMVSLIYVVLAVLALSFLIFIHELGHYFMARRVGMRVETFSIGFGHPIFSWVRDGVKWQIGWLLFGGYVKIAGQDLESEEDPYAVSDGFFGKSAFDRIKVAFMGPFVNLLFAFLIFSLLWLDGGREKNFSEFTHKIGWVDPHSELFAQGVRPGDEIISYNGQLYETAKDHLYAPMTSASELDVKGFKVNYRSGEKTPFEYKIKPYSHPNSLDKAILTSGITQPANYIIYNTLPGGAENPIPEGAPLQESGIQYGDRIIWMDGEAIYSIQQLGYLLNDGRTLLTVQRGGKTFFRRVPRVQVQELKLDSEFKEELIDWQHEAHLNGIKTANLYTLPYNLTNDARVENEVRFIDKEHQIKAFPNVFYSDLEQPLLPGDRIIAINGTPISYSYELLEGLQHHQVNAIVQRKSEGWKKISSKEEDADFNQQIDWKEVDLIVQSIGNQKTVKKSGQFYLLNPIVPKASHAFKWNGDKQTLMTAELQEQKKGAEADDVEKKNSVQNVLKNQDNELKLGLPSVQDRRVSYNPDPLKMFSTIFNEIRNTLTALITFTLNPKWISGPVGIIQVVHDNWMLGISEALFWIGAISLNLGILNLLPIPMLDGGTILFSLYEIVTGKKISPKTLEKVTLPFAILLIGFFLFLTYNDFLRAFEKFFN